MSYRCKYCGGSHTKPETGRECYRLHREKLAAKAADPPSPGVFKAAQANPLPLLSGGYALGQWVVEVTVPDRGKWAGHPFLNLYDESGDLEAVTTLQDRQFIVDKLFEAGIKECMVKYGQQTGVCPVCRHPLNSDLEHAAGYHQDSVVAGATCYMELNA